MATEQYAARIGNEINPLRRGIFTIKTDALQRQFAGTSKATVGSTIVAAQSAATVVGTFTDIANPVTGVLYYEGDNNRFVYTIDGGTTWLTVTGAAYA